jgi:uncharacterized protein YgbK (DUF1537 family)
MSHPIRVHISLEKKTVAKLQKLARGRAQTLTQIVRDLVESYATGRLSLPGGESLSQVIRRIQALRLRSAPVPDRSETLIRSLRDARA